MKRLITILILSFSTIGFSQTVVDYKLSECENLNSEYVRNRIISQTWDSDTLLLKIGFVENCSITPSVVVEQSNDSLFLLIENTSTTYAVCNCSFEIDLKLIGVTDTNFTLIYRKHETVIVEKRGFIDTITNETIVLNDSKYRFPKESELKNYTHFNQFNKDGRKIGLWKEFYPNSDSIVKYYTYIPMDNKINNSWHFLYNKDETLNKVCFTKGGYSICIEKEEYYELMNKEKQ